MPDTPSKVPTTSSTAKIENVANEVLAGLPALPSLLQVQELAKAVLFLLKENHRLTTNNEELLRQLHSKRSYLEERLKELERRQAVLDRQAQARKTLPPLEGRVPLRRRPLQT